MALMAIWVGYFTLKMHQIDSAFFTWNENEWRIDHDFARPSLLARFINTECFGDGSLALYLVRVSLVSPALNRVVQLMEEADKDEKSALPKILCNERARTSLQQRVDDFFTDVKSSTSLTVMGKMILYQSSYDGLVNHHGLLQLGMNAHVQNEVIKEPVFIVSPPRTGTTILHRTMALDKSRFRSFDFSDMTIPFPNMVPRWDDQGRIQKAKEGEQFIRLYDTVYPGIVKCVGTMHTLGPAEADEDLGWLDHGLGHRYRTLFKLYPEYRNKVKNKDDDGSWGNVESDEVAEYRYAWLAMIMKIYQWIDKDEWKQRHNSGDGVLQNNEHPTSGMPWIMKDPNHAPRLNELLAQFPDAKFIFIHRNPADIVTSLAKLYAVFISMDFIPGSRGSSAKELGEEAVLRTKYYSNGIIGFTREHTFNQVSSPYSLYANSTSRIDLHFEDLVRDVPGAIQKIHQQFYPNEDGPSDTAMEAMNNYLKQQQSIRKRSQRRSLQDLHLTSNDVPFTEYNDLFLSIHDVTSSTINATH